MIELTRYVRVRRFAEITGDSEGAVRARIRDGIWMEGREYHRDPQGLIRIDMEGYMRWVETGPESGRQVAPQSKSRSRTKASDSGREYSSSPPPLA